MNIENITKAERLIAQMREVERFRNRLSEQGLSHDIIRIGVDDYVAVLNTKNVHHTENSVFARKLVYDMCNACEAHLVELKAELALL